MDVTTETHLLTPSGLRAVVRRWVWLVVATVVVCMLAVGLHYRSARPMYKAQAALQITAPQQEGVSLYNQTFSMNLRDEMTVARNNFIELSQSRQIYARTLEQLGPKVRGMDYRFVLNPLLDSDFIYATVQNPNPKLAAELVNTHVKTAIDYYGEVRSKQAGEERKYLATRVVVAKRQLEAALAARADYEITRGVDQTAEPASLGKLDLLTENVRQARATYRLLANKFSEAVLTEDSVKNASFIQVVALAAPPSKPVSSRLVPMLVLALIGGLGLGVVFAVTVDLFTRTDFFTRTFGRRRSTESALDDRPRRLVGAFRRRELLEPDPPERSE